MIQKRIKDIEIELLLEAIYQRYGYDYRNFSQAIISRKIEIVKKKGNFETIGQMIPVLLHNEHFFPVFLEVFHERYNDIFRDPSFYKALREILAKIASNDKTLKIWFVGCSTGEELYSVAITLVEEGIYDRCRIFATDIIEPLIKKASQGIFPEKYLKIYDQNYIRSDGKKKLSDYFTIDSENATIDGRLRQNITFSLHNYISDKQFEKVDIIICRNSLIYFNEIQQEKTLQMFAQSLENDGILCLGLKESIDHLISGNKFRYLSKEENIFQIKDNQR